VTPTNGQAGAPVRDQLRETRARLRLLRDQASLREAEQLERRAKLRESYAFDWVSPYLELINRTNDGFVPLGIGGRYSRKHGKYFPLFRTEAELRLLREPARIVTATNPYAIGLLEGVCGYVVGTGYTYTVQIEGNEDDYPGLVKALQKIVDEYLERNGFGGNDDGTVRLSQVEADRGEQPGLEEEAFRRVSVDGEFFNVTTHNDDGTTDERVVEPDQVTIPPGKDDREWGFGIHTELWDAQKPLAYWVQWGEAPTDGEEYGPPRMTHIRANSWRTVKRGLTDWCFDTLDTVQLANLLRGNLGETGAQQASIVGVRQYVAGTRDQISSFNDSLADEIRLDAATGQQYSSERRRRGTWEDIPEGFGYVPGPIAQSTPIHLQVLQALLRGAAVRWNATEWLASGDSSNNAYASSLTANNQFVVSVKRRQKLLRGAFGMMVARALMHAVKIAGGVKGTEGITYSPELIQAVVSLAVSCPSPESVDPLAQAQRFDLECTKGVRSIQTWQADVGLDSDKEQANRDKFKELNPDFGTPLAVPPFGADKGVTGATP